MIRFTDLERLGLRVAAMSTVEDGDCGSRPEAQPYRRAFLEKLGAAPDSAVAVNQVHGNRVLNVGEGHAGTIAGTADGLVTIADSLPLCIGVADCVPVLLFCPDRHAIAALHSGREGTLRNVAEMGLEQMCSVSGCTPEKVWAQIGPCICGRHYEVSEEIAQEFRDAGHETSGRYLNLPVMVARQLMMSGVPREQIFAPPACTLEDHRFHSFRRDNTPQRNLAVLML